MCVCVCLYIISLFRCVDPVDVVMCDDVTVAESLKLNPQYSMAGYVVMKDADSAKYVIQASQGVVLELSNRVSVEADIILSFRSRSDFFVNLKMEHVPIALNNINTMNFREYCKRHQKDISKRIFKVKAQFQIKHQYFQDLHEAVDNIPQVMIKRLFPPASIVKRSFYKSNDTDNSSNLEPPFVLDNLQSQAISSMLSAGTEAPFLLVGPFGTGKTHVLACVAAAIVKNNANAKILIATHHNKSADTFISKYFGTLASTKTLPLTVAPIRVTTREWNEDLEKSYFVKCNDPTVTQELLDERRIVVTTFLTALRFASTIKLPRGYFTHILIDEGAQTREPEAIAPLIFADTSTKVIIAGDHLQVKLLHLSKSQCLNVYISLSLSNAMRILRAAY